MRDLPQDPLFLEPDLDWHEVSPRLITERRIPVAAVALGAVAVLVVGIVGNAKGSVPVWPFAAVAAALAIVALVLWFVLVPRMALSWRYAERQQDLVVRRGRLVRRLTVVPYGRMQVIQVRSNPIAHRLGIATVTLVTASADTDAHITGLPVDVAQALRDRLAAKGEALTAGL
jgi:membrane protein YdbS with pleckstrin-like domain